MKEVLAVILGGGRGTRLFPLTAHRSKPAVPIGGKYRLIDIPISNCLNSHLRRIIVLPGVSFLRIGGFRSDSEGVDGHGGHASFPLRQLLGGQRLG